MAHLSHGIKQHSFKGILIYTEDWVWKHCPGTWCCSAFECSCPPDPGAQYLSLWSMIRLLCPLSQRFAHRKTVEFGFVLKKSNLINIHISQNHNCSTQSSDWVTDIMPASEFPAWAQCNLTCAVSQHCHFQRDVPEGARGFMWERAVANQLLTSADFIYGLARGRGAPCF